MNALIILGFLAGVIYGIFVNCTFMMIYLAIVVAYTVMVEFFWVDKKHVTKRKNIAVTSWSQAVDPTCYLECDYDVTKSLSYIKQ